MEIKLLSVVVPIYKQEKTIQRDLLSLYETLANTPYKFEILAVVDGTSLDNSFREAKKLKKPELTVLGYPTNKGKGQAIRYGMKYARGDVVIFIDAGMDISHSSIIMLLEHMKWYDADIIVASKMHPASKVENYTTSRKLITKGYYFLVKFLFGLKIRDTQTGLKAFRRNVIESILDKLVVKTFAFDIEILSVAYNSGFRKICDCPVEIIFDKNNTSLVGKKLLKSVIEVGLDTLAVWYRLHILRYYQDGRYRKKYFDKELQMYVNTGEMKDKRQKIIDFVNFVLTGLSLNPNRNDKKKI